MTKNDEIDLIEKHFNVNINVYTHDVKDTFRIDRRSICNYNDTLNLMRYNNHFMYIKDLNKLDIVIDVVNVIKYLKIWKHVTVMKKHVMY